MARYIDADVLMKELEREVELADDWKTAHEIVNVVKYAPTVDVAPVIHAHWVITDYAYLDCSNCGETSYTGAESLKEVEYWLEKGYFHSYCPYCGAKMDGKENEQWANV